MTETELRAWLTLRAAEGVGCATVWSLVQIWPSPTAILAASFEELVARGCSQALAKAIRRPLDKAQRTQLDGQVKALSRQGLTILSCLDEAYPAGLTTLPDPPTLLYCTGQWHPDDACAVALVGSRRATPAGRAVTERLSGELAGAGWTIVSGLARGIDGAAHRGALAAGGRTIAVLGCGIDRTYSPEHAALRREIEGQGVVVSECAIGAPPHSYHFPQRNRIISGLSRGVVVTEATLDSGSLITARLAAEYGREVFAVPGSIREANSRGPHQLIKSGAKLVETAEDVLVELWPQLDEASRRRLTERVPRAPAESPPVLRDGQDEETVILGGLTAEPVHIDALAERTKLPTAVLTARLLALVLRGLVCQLPGQWYLRK